MIDSYSEYSQENSPRAVESYIPPLSPDSVMEDETPAQADDVDLVEAPAKGKRGNVKKSSSFVWKDEEVYHLINSWQKQPVLFNM